MGSPETMGSRGQTQGSAQGCCRQQLGNLVWQEEQGYL